MRRISRDRHPLFAPGNHRQIAPILGIADEPEVGLIFQHRLVNFIRPQIFDMKLRARTNAGKFLPQTGHLRKPDRINRRHPDGAFGLVP